MQRDRFAGAFGAVLAVAIGAAGLGCGAAPPPPAAEATPPQIERDDSGPARPSFESEIGALDEGRVKTIFKNAAGKLTQCFSQGTEKLPFLAGEVRFVIRVAKDGSARWAYVKDSTLGDRATEECMLGVLKSAGWPKPQGGEGLAENSYTFEPGGDDRPPVAWSPDQLGAPYKHAKPALSRCRTKSGAASMKATLYVDTDGKASSIGVSSSDEKGEAAVACVIGALKDLRFPSPGSYASKVSVVID